MPDVKKFSDWSLDAKITEPADQLREYSNYVRTAYMRSGELTGEVETEIQNGAWDKANELNLLPADAPDEEREKAFRSMLAPKQDVEKDARFVLDYYAKSFTDELDDPTEAKEREEVLRTYLARRKAFPESAAELQESVNGILSDADTVRRARIAAVDRGDMPVVALREADGNTSFYAKPDVDDKYVAGSFDTLVATGAVDPSDAYYLKDFTSPTLGGATTKSRLAGFDEFQRVFREMSENDPELMKRLQEASAEYTRTGQRSQRSAVAVAGGLVGDALAALASPITDAIGGPQEFVSADIAAQLLKTPAIARKYSKEQLEQYAQDLVLHTSKPVYNAEKPETGIALDSNGIPVIAPALLVRDDAFGAAMEAAGLNDAQREYAIGDRERDLAAQTPEFKRLILGNDLDAVDLYAQAKASGKSDEQFVKEYFSNDDNYSSFATTAKGFGMSLVKVVSEIPLAVAAIAGSEGSAKVLVDMNKDAQDRVEYARMFGDEFGIGRDALFMLPQLATDILLTVGTAGVGTAVKKGGTAIASGIGRGLERASARKMAATLGRAALDSSPEGAAAIRKLVSGATDASAKEAFEKVAESAVRRHLRNAAAVTPVAITSFARSASSTYGSLYSMLPDDLSHEEKNRQVVPFAIASGFSTAIITSGLSYIGAGGFEDLATGRITAAGTSSAAAGSRFIPLEKLTGRQLKYLHEQVRNAGRAMTDKEFQSVLRTELSGAYKQTFRNIFDGVKSEAFEETLDQAFQIGIQDLATGKKTSLDEVGSQLLSSAILGGAMGGGGNAITEAKPMSRSQRTQALEATGELLTNIVGKLKSSGSPQTAAALATRMNLANAAAERSRRADLREQTAREEAAKAIKAGDLDPTDKPFVQGELDLGDVNSAKPDNTLLIEQIGERVQIGGYTGTLELNPESGTVQLKLAKPLKDGQTHFNVGSKYDNSAKAGVVPTGTLPKLGQDSGPIKAGTPYLMPDKGSKAKFALPDTVAGVEYIENFGGAPAIRIVGARMIGQPNVSRDMVITDGSTIRNIINHYGVPKADLPQAKSSAVAPKGRKSGKKAADAAATPTAPTAPTTAGQDQQLELTLPEGTAPKPTAPAAQVAPPTSEDEAGEALKGQFNVDGSSVSFAEIPYTTRYADESGALVDKSGSVRVIDIAGRKLVVAVINGVRVPFYVSTGSGGKAEVPAGKWYPIFGIADSWFNKKRAADINSYYGSEDLAAVAKFLDARLGDIRSLSMEARASAANPDSPHIKAINEGLNPVANGSGVEALDRNIKDVVSRLSAAKPTVKRPAAPAAAAPVAPAPAAAAPVVRKSEKATVQYWLDSGYSEEDAEMYALIHADEVDTTPEVLKSPAGQKILDLLEDGVTADEINDAASELESDELSELEEALSNAADELMQEGDEDGELTVVVAAAALVDKVQVAKFIPAKENKGKGRGKGKKATAPVVDEQVSPEGEVPADSLPADNKAGVPPVEGGASVTPTVVEAAESSEDADPEGPLMRNDVDAQRTYARRVKTLSVMDVELRKAMMVYYLREAYSNDSGSRLVARALWRTHDLDGNRRAEVEMSEPPRLEQIAVSGNTNWVEAIEQMAEAAAKVTAGPQTAARDLSKVEQLTPAEYVQAFRDQQPKSRLTDKQILDNQKGMLKLALARISGGEFGLKLSSDALAFHGLKLPVNYKVSGGLAIGVTQAAAPKPAGLVERRESAEEAVTDLTLRLVELSVSTPVFDIDGELTTVESLRVALTQLQQRIDAAMESGNPIPDSVIAIGEQMAANLQEAEALMAEERADIEARLRALQKADGDALREDKAEDLQDAIDVVSGKKDTFTAPKSKKSGKPVALPPAPAADSEFGEFRNEFERELFESWALGGFLLGNIKGEGRFSPRALQVIRKDGTVESLPLKETEVKQRLYAAVNSLYPFVEPKGPIGFVTSQQLVSLMVTAGRARIALPANVDKEGTPVSWAFTNNPLVTAAQIDTGKLEIIVPKALLKDKNFKLNPSIKINEKTGKVLGVHSNPDADVDFGLTGTNKLVSKEYKSVKGTKAMRENAVLREPASKHLRPRPERTVTVGKKVFTLPANELSAGRSPINKVITTFNEAINDAYSAIANSYTIRELVNYYKLRDTFAAEAGDQAIYEYGAHLKKYAIARAVDDALAIAKLADPKATLLSVDVAKIVSDNLVSVTKGGGAPNIKEALQILSKGTKLSGATDTAKLNDFGRQMHELLSSTYRAGVPSFTKLFERAARATAASQNRRPENRTFSYDDPNAEMTIGQIMDVQAYGWEGAIARADSTVLGQLAVTLEDSPEAYDMLFRIVRRAAPDLSEETDPKELIMLAGGLLANTETADARRILATLKGDEGLKLANHLIDLGWLPAASGEQVITPVDRRQIPESVDRKIDTILGKGALNQRERNVRLKMAKKVADRITGVYLSRSEDGAPVADAARIANRKALADLQIESNDPESVVEGLREIARTGLPQHRIIADLLLENPDLIRSVNFNIGDFNDVRFAGAFLPASNLVVLNLSGHNGRGAADVLLHEYLHAVTHQIVSNPQTAAQRSAVARIRALRLLTKNYADRTGVNMNRFGAPLESDLEFITYALTSPEFQGIISGATPAAQRSLLRRVIDAVLSVFGKSKPESRIPDAVNELIDFTRMFASESTFSIDVNRTAAHQAESIAYALEELESELAATEGELASSDAVLFSSESGGVWDNEGIGSTPNQVDIDYFGFVLPMSHAEFRSLVIAGNSNPDTVGFAKDAITSGDKLAPPFLQVRWDEENFVWRVTGHEGRSRSDAANELGLGDSIPVHVLPIGLRARSITEEMRSAPFVPEGGGDPVTPFRTGAVFAQPVTPQSGTVALDPVPFIRNLLPEGMVLRANPNMRDMAGVHPDSPTVLQIHPEHINNLIAGLDKRAAEAVLTSLVDHEVAHAAVLSELTEQDVEAIISDIGEDVLQATALRYYGNTYETPAEIAAAVKADRESGALTDRTIAHEWLRMQVELRTKGSTYESDLRYNRSGAPAIIKIIARALAKFARAMRDRFGAKPTAETAASISKAERAFRQMTATSNKDSGLLPESGDQTLEFFSALDGAPMDDRALFALPVLHSNPQKVERMMEKLKLYNLPSVLRDVQAMRDGATNTVSAIIKSFTKQFPKLYKEAIKANVAPEDISMLLGTTAPMVTDADRDVIEKQVKAFADALPADTPYAESEKLIGEKRSALLAGVRLAYGEAFRKQQKAAEERVRAAGFPKLVAEMAVVRQEINKYSDYLGFEETGDVYLTRSYRFFTTTGWALAARSGSGILDVDGKKVDFDKLRAVAAESYAEQAEQELRKAANGMPVTEAAIAARTAEMLDDYLATLQRLSTSVDPAMVESIKQDINRLKPKRDINEAMRELLGEHDDPMYNAVNTLHRVSQMAINQRFQKDFAKQLIDLKLATRNPDPNSKDQVQLYDARMQPTVGPMAGLWVDKNIANVWREAFGNNGAGQESNSTALVSGVGRTLSKLTGLSMHVKTQLGVGYYVRNAIGGFILGAAQGILWTPFTKAGRYAAVQSRAAAFSNLTDEQHREQVLRLIELNILNDQSQSRVVQDLLRGFASTPQNDLAELMADIEELRVTEGRGGAIANALKTGKFTGHLKGLAALGTAKYGSFVQILSAIDATVDGTYKANAFYFELNALKKHHGDSLSKEELEVAAARKVKLTFAGHSQVIDPVKSFNRSPLAQVVLPFARWKSEVIRTMLNTVPLALEEIAAGGSMRMRGVRRLAGFTATLTAMPTILGTFATLVFRALTGDDEDDERRLNREELEGLREALPEWQKGHQLFAQVLSGGKVQLIDMSYVLPHSQITDISSMMIDGIASGRGIDGGRIASYVVKDMIGTQIAFGTADQILNNRDDFDRPIYLETDSTAHKVGSILSFYVRNAAEPSIYAKGKDILRTGQQNRLELVAGELLGVRPKSYQFDDIERRGFRNLKSIQDNAVGVIGELASGRYKDGEKIGEIVDRHQDGLNETQRRMNQFIRTMSSLGSSQASIRASAKLYRFSDDTIDSAFSGYRVAWYPDSGNKWADKVYENTQRAGEQDPREKLRLIYEALQRKPDLYWVNGRSD